MILIFLQLNNFFSLVSYIPDKSQSHCVDLRFVVNIFSLASRCWDYKRDTP